MLTNHYSILECIKEANKCILYSITEAIDGQTSVTMAPMEGFELNSPSFPPHTVRPRPLHSEPGILMNYDRTIPLICIK